MKTKILVVDDEADLELLIKQKFRRKIRENAYEFLFASNGQEALDRLRDHPDTDIVLSDINMPVTKTVMVSAYGDMENIRAAMNRGAFDFVCKPVDFTDLELTMEKTIVHVQQLRDTMRAIQENNILKMYVDETVINFMARPGFENKLLASETVEATVMFVDICGFTSLSESQPAATVVSLLNKYFDQIVQEVIEHGGYIDKFMGDAVMAVFRGDYHLDRAIDAALLVRAKLQAAHDTLPDGTAYNPAVSIGINTGEMVSGNIGSASLKRLDYTVIGDTVNVSQRLQSAGQPNQIVITDAIYERIKESFECQPIGELKLKNKAHPIMTYEVVA
jgi:adenylate cyclase